MDKKTIIFMILEAIIFLGIIVSISQCSSRKIDVLDQNLLAAQDEIELVRLENGNLLADKSAYIIKEKELQEILDITKEEKKEIEKQLKEKIAYISNIKTHIQIDTIELKDTIIIEKDSNVNIQFNYTDKWIQMNGNTIFDPIKFKSTTTLNSVNIYTPLKVGLTEDYTIFVESENPYLNITDIEGAVIDGSKLYPKKKKWNLSIQGGVGANYGFINKQFDIGPYVGVGVSYNFF